jgi:membrane protein implicated in regulation of membrane protease activity
MVFLRLLGFLAAALAAFLGIISAATLAVGGEVPPGAWLRLFLYSAVAFALLTLAKAQKGREQEGGGPRDGPGSPGA